ATIITAIMNLSGDQFFAGAGLSQNKNAGIRLRDFLDQGIDLFHVFGSPDELSKLLFPGELFFESRILFSQSNGFKGVVNLQAQILEVERFCEVIISSLLYRLHRQTLGTMRGYDNHQRGSRMSNYSGQKIQAGFSP